MPGKVATDNLPPKVRESTAQQAMEPIISQLQEDISRSEFESSLLATEIESLKGLIAEERLRLRHFRIARNRDDWEVIRAAAPRLGSINVTPEPTLNEGEDKYGDLSQAVADLAAEFRKAAELSEPTNKRESVVPVGLINQDGTIDQRKQVKESASQDCGNVHSTAFANWKQEFDRALTPRPIDKAALEEETLPRSRILETTPPRNPTPEALPICRGTSPRAMRSAALALVSAEVPSANSPPRSPRNAAATLVLGSPRGVGNDTGFLPVMRQQRSNVFGGSCVRLASTGPSDSDVSTQMCQSCQSPCANIAVVSPPPEAMQDRNPADRTFSPRRSPLNPLNRPNPEADAMPRQMLVHPINHQVLQDISPADRPSSPSRSPLAAERLKAGRVSMEVPAKTLIQKVNTGEGAPTRTSRSTARSTLSSRKAPRPTELVVSSAENSPAMSPVNSKALKGAARTAPSRNRFDQSSTTKCSSSPSSSSGVPTPLSFA